MARPGGLETTTSSLEDWRSIQLSYGRAAQERDYARVSVAGSPGWLVIDAPAGNFVPQPSYSAFSPADQSDTQRASATFEGRAGISWAFKTVPQEAVASATQPAQSGGFLMPIREKLQRMELNILAVLPENWGNSYRQFGGSRPGVTDQT